MTSVEPELRLRYKDHIGESEIAYSTLAEAMREYIAIKNNSDVYFAELSIVLDETVKPKGGE